LIFRLIIMNGHRRGERVTVPLEPMTIGRGPSCGLVIDDPEAAVEHAVVEHFNGGLLVRDLGSMNRILVNKREIQRAILKHGDALEIGRTRMLVQAFVQAEIAGAGSGPRRSRRSAAPVAVVFTLLALSSWIWLRREPESPERAGAAEIEDPAAESSNALASAAVDPLPPPPPPSVTVVTNVGPDPKTVEELQHLRTELATIREAFQTLARQQRSLEEWAAAAPVKPPPESKTSTPAPVPAPAPAWSAASELAAARAHMAANRWDEADRALDGIQRTDPGFLPAYEARAELFERRGRLDRALGQWSMFFQRAAGTPTSEKAAVEWGRLTMEKRRMIGRTGGPVRIADLDIQRFPDSADYDDMRLVRIRLECDPAKRVPENLRVVVVFFDRDDRVGDVALTRAMQPSVEAQTAGQWVDGKLNASAAYVAPAGYRAANPGRFYGYVVRVYAGQALLDEAARPADLLIRSVESARVR